MSNSNSLLSVSFRYCFLRFSNLHYTQKLLFSLITCFTRFWLTLYLLTFLLDETADDLGLRTSSYRLRRCKRAAFYDPWKIVLLFSILYAPAKPIYYNSSKKKEKKTFSCSSNLKLKMQVLISFFLIGRNLLFWSIILLIPDQVWEQWCSFSWLFESSR